MIEPLSPLILLKAVGGEAIYACYKLDENLYLWFFLDDTARIPEIIPVDRYNASLFIDDAVLDPNGQYFNNWAIEQITQEGLDMLIPEALLHYQEWRFAQNEIEDPDEQL